MTKSFRVLMFVFVLMSFMLAACGGAATAEAPAVEPTTAPAELTEAPAEPSAAPAEDPMAMYAPEAVSVDVITAGSSTVFPLSERMKQRFEEEGFTGNLTVDSIGSGAGIDRFCVAGEIDIANARIEVYARWEQVKSAVISHFSDAEAAALAKRLQKTIDAYSSVPLHDAYLQDPAFIGLGGSSDLLSGLVELVKSHLLKGESKRVMALFDAPNKGKLVQGISFSRDYSGCLLVTFELAVTKEGIYEVSAFMHRTI